MMHSSSVTIDSKCPLVHLYYTINSFKSQELGHAGLKGIHVLACCTLKWVRDLRKGGFGGTAVQRADDVGSGREHWNVNGEEDEPKRRLASESPPSLSPPNSPPLLSCGDDDNTVRATRTRRFRPVMTEPGALSGGGGRGRGGVTDEDGPMAAAATAGAAAAAKHSANRERRGARCAVCEE